MTILTDPEEIARAAARDAQFDKNLAFFDAHADAIYRNHRGRFVFVAGQELFVADSAREVIGIARQAHPADRGWFTRIIPLENIPRIYVAPR
jgi:hypothetical protein